MSTKQQPATALPWHEEPIGQGCSYIHGASDETVAHHGDSTQTDQANAENGTYLVHAANAYPQLVAYAKALVQMAREVESTRDVSNVLFLDAIMRTEALLRSLGEL